MWSGATSTDNTVVKTIYDPCPIGYTVAPTNAFSNFTTPNWDSTNRGNTLGGLWFPGEGLRASSSGVLSNVGIIGWFWQAVPYNASYTRFLDFRNGTVNTANYTHRSEGMSIRPVLEKD